jgi:hypothetical protein
MKRLTQGIWEPKDGVAWEEKGALARAVSTDGARDVEVALAYSAGIGFCTFAVGFAIRAGPGAACAAFCNTAAGFTERVACRSMTDGGAENLETRRDQRLSAFLSDAAGFERSADSSTPLCVGMAPDSQAHAVVGDGAASADTGGCLLLVHGRSGDGGRGEYGGGAEIGGGRTGVGKGIVCVGVGEGGCGRRAIGGEDGAAKEANVGRGRGKGGGGGGEGEGEVVYGAGGLESGGDDLDLAGEGKLERTVSGGEEGEGERTLSALDNIFPTSALESAPAPLRTSVGSPFAFFFFFLPPPAPGETVLPRTSGRHQRATAPSEWWRPRTESGSARVHVWGLFGRPETR